ncbi:MAG: DNA gyrase subunit A [Candidatus Zophobacter franzmannii]|nr:DNA gyrase subunit A [Candidatus Zophobacter franzmannii]
MKDTDSRIIPIQIEDELKKSYMEYSMSVIVARALPDVRDGLKPSQRRIIFAMHELNLKPGAHFRKCAKIAGDTSGKYYRHGEQVVYPTLVRLAQPWNMRYPLIDGQGNFGSIDGDPPAAMRYTEARLQRITTEMLDDLDKETVDYRSNYDETRKEPVIFPAKIPNLLVNGSSGIAVGMATSMPPHNLGEVCDGVVALVDNPDMQPLDFLPYIQGPDFPTKGFIVGKTPIHDYFETGRGKLKVRGKADIEIKKDAEYIIISEIPYQLNKTLLIEKIADLVKIKKIEGISDIRDESGRQGMRLVIKVKRNADASIVLNKLYKYSQLQSTFSVINLCLVDGIPKILDMKTMIQQFIDFRHQVIVRRANFELRNAEARLHLLEGFRIALDHIDEVIATIRASKNAPEASEKLQEKFKFSERQAKAILEMRLQRLTGLERDKIEQEYNEILSKISGLRELLSTRELQMQMIKDEIAYIKNKYADPRGTSIVADTGDLSIEDLIPEETVVVTISHQGYIKRMTASSYKSQGRGGRGLRGSNLKETDFVVSIFLASTHDYILFFTNFGQCFWLKVYEIPDGSRLSRGKAIVNLLPLKTDEKIEAFVSTKNLNQDDKYIMMSTKRGLVKKSTLSKFSNPRSSGIIAIKLVEGDELIEALITNGADDIILATRHGYCNRFNEVQVRAVGRNSQGVRGITLRNDDNVVSMVATDPETEDSLLAISECGFGKRTDLGSYVTKNRGTKGVITLKTTTRNGELVSLMKVNDEDDLMIVTKNGMIIRQHVSEINSIGRNTQGVTLINLKNKDKVFDITVIPTNRHDEVEDESVEATDDKVKDSNGDKE